jgi:hypothetical protein
MNIFAPDANRFLAYGLSIQSPIPLPGLAEAPGPADIVVRTGAVRQISHAAAGEMAASVGGASSWVASAGVGACEIRDGREIIMERAAGGDDAEFRDFLMGPALAFALLQRGRVILHATAVEIAGRAVAFVAASGGGKSTTAAAFYAKGFTLITDDFLSVTLDGNEPVAHGGPARLKLLPDAVEHFGDDPSTLEVLSRRFPKRVRALERPRNPRAIPLARIYELSTGPRTSIEPLHGHRAVAALLPHAGVLPRLQQPETRHYLELCVALANRVPVLRLSRQKSLDSLPAVLDAVRENIASA